MNFTEEPSFFSEAGGTPSRAQSEWALCCGSVSGRGAQRYQKNDSFVWIDELFQPQNSESMECLSINIYSICIYRGSLYTYQSLLWHDMIA
uniref:Uncharacterized protein n=1 Tax=Raphanus sativus TaxID=3726 RepID=A0A650GBQ6_RAPSA|nr:hypothetical protein [Raphanus sativus]QGW48628.1 hypothetical protein [Raphanus sativus]